MTPRDYQNEDVLAVIDAHEAHQCVLGRAATGMGKAVELMLIAQHYMQFGRVLILVDMRKLLRQLVDTCEWVTGVKPGIEASDQFANNGDGLHGADPIVISMVQTQYSGADGHERYRSFLPQDFAVLLLDETELFLAPKARSVVDYYVKGNPKIRVCGVTATPMRTDGIAMAELFDCVAFDRDILWGIENGWLVPARQAFVRVSLDFSSLSLSENEDGESDYNAEQMAKQLIENEAALIELAKGIVYVSGNMRTIVVCPTVAAAKAVSHYIESEKPNASRCIYGEQSDEQKDELFDGHQRGDYQYLCSCMLLTKGYDDPQLLCVVNCRKTKSKRLYTQIIGRSVRPLKGVVDGMETAEERRAAIAASGKSFALCVNMVGVDASVRDISIVDILGHKETAQVIEAAKELMMDDAEMTLEDALANAKAVADAKEEASALAAKHEAENLDRHDEDDLYRQIRRRVSVSGAIDVEYEDDLRVGGSSNATDIPPNVMSVLEKARVPAGVMARLSPENAIQLSHRIISRYRSGRCTYRQEACLRKFGYGPEETEVMSIADAKLAIDAIAANGWRRPQHLEFIS